MKKPSKKEISAAIAAAMVGAGNSGDTNLTVNRKGGAVSMVYTALDAAEAKELRAISDKYKRPSGPRSMVYTPTDAARAREMSAVIEKYKKLRGIPTPTSRFGISGPIRGFATMSGGAHEDSSSESESDDMEGGFLGSLVGIASRAMSYGSKAATAASAASKAAAAAKAATALRVARAATASKAAATAASKASAIASQATKVAPSIASRVFNAANVLGVAAGVGIPIYQVTQMIQQSKDDAEARRAQDLAQQKADADTVKALADNQRMVDDAIGATTAERERYETEKKLIEDAYADAAEAQRQQAEAFQKLLEMAYNGQTYKDINSSTMPPVAEGPVTKDEIEQAKRDASGLTPPPKSNPPPPKTTYPPVTAPPPPPTPSAPVTAPPSKRKKGGRSLRMPQVNMPTDSEVKKAIASARRARKKGGSDFF
jgi:hypothetical protein